MDLVEGEGAGDRVWLWLFELRLLLMRGPKRPTTLRHVARLLPPSALLCLGLLDPEVLLSLQHLIPLRFHLGGAMSIRSSKRGKKRQSANVVSYQVIIDEVGG